MFKNLTLGRQLAFSFSAMLVILFVVSMVAVNGLSQGFTNFKDYRGLARDTNLAGRLQANMLMVRLNVLKYISDANPVTLNEYQERKGKMQSFLALSVKEIKNPMRADNIAQSVKLFTQYETGFDSVVSLIDQRNAIVNNKLNPAGLAMRQKMTELIQLAKDANNLEVLFLTAKAQEALLLGRLFVIKYLVSNQHSDFERAIKELEQNLVPILDQIKDISYDQKNQELLNQIYHNREQYDEAFKKVNQFIMQRNDLITNTLNRVGPMLAEKIEQVKLSVKAEKC